MTSPSPHLDLDALADALAGESAEADATHLAGCASCAGRLEELRAAEGAVIAQLQGVGTPALPAEVAARLDAALAEQEPLVPARAASVTALPVRRARRSTAGWLPAAAAAVLVLGGAGLAASLVASGAGEGAGDTAASTAGGAVETSPVADLLLTASGADWADPTTPATALPQVLGGGATAYRLADEDAEARDRAAQEDATTESQAEDQAAAPEAAAALPEADGELARLTTPEGLQECLSSLLDVEEEPGVRPLAVDYATYDGQPALAVVLPDPDPSQASIFVVGSDCSAADPDVLLFRRAPLP